MRTGEDGEDKGEGERVAGDVEIEIDRRMHEVGGHGAERADNESERIASCGLIRREVIEFRIEDLEKPAKSVAQMHN